MKILTGRITSIKNINTAVVEVERIFRHRLYEKKMRRTKKYHVHIETEAAEGQVIRFEKTRPYSKTKHWRLIGKGMESKESTQNRGVKSKKSDKEGK